MDHHHVVGEYARLQHGLSPYPEGEVLAGEAAGVKGEVFLDVLLGQDGGARRHIAHQGHLVPAAVGGVGDGDGPGLALGLGDAARLPQALEVEMDGGGGLQPHGLGDLTHGGGVAVFVCEGQDVVIDLLLFGR